MSIAEAIVLAMKAGLDCAPVQRAGGGRRGPSRLCRALGSMMKSGDYFEVTMKVDLLLKDMTIIADFARVLGYSTPLLLVSSPFYAFAFAAGLGEEDTAAVTVLGFDKFERKPAERRTIRH